MELSKEEKEILYCALFHYLGGSRVVNAPEADVQRLMRRVGVSLDYYPEDSGVDLALRGFFLAPLLENFSRLIQ